MIMEATARHNILNSIFYKRKKWLPLSVRDRRKSLYQAVSAHLPTGNSAETAYLHCIKLGTNIDPAYSRGNSEPLTLNVSPIFQRLLICDAHPLHDFQRLYSANTTKNGRSYIYQHQNNPL